MSHLLPTLLIASVLVAQAQTTPTPFGHWQGSVSVPTGDVRIEVDLARNPNGEWVGAFSGTTLTGFPLSHVSVGGGGVTFEVPATGGGRFEGQLSGDGKSLSGVFNASEGVAPFNLVRTGDARIELPPKNARIRKDMEGDWIGALETDGQQLRLLLKLSNQPDGMSAASIVSLDEGGFELPVAIVQEGANLTIDLKATGATWSGSLNAEGTELIGTFTQRSAVLPMTFRRVADPI